MVYQLWQGNGLVVDMDVSGPPTSDNTLESFVTSVAYWLREEPSANYRIIKRELHDDTPPTREEWGPTRRPF